MIVGAVGAADTAVLEIVPFEEHMIVGCCRGRKLLPRLLATLTMTLLYSVQRAFEHCFCVDKERDSLH